MDLNNSIRPNIKVSALAGLSTYMTMSYIFLLNPVLLQKAGVDISSAFFATILTGFISTLIMGLWAKTPFAVAPVPSITTFFVGYVCLELQLPWEAALAAVFISGIISILAARFYIKEQLVRDPEPRLASGILLTLCVFLCFTGLRQAGIVNYAGDFRVLDFSQLSLDLVLSKNSAILLTGLVFTLIFSTNKFRIQGAPVIGILFATIAAFVLGKGATPDMDYTKNATSSFFALDFGYFFSEYSLQFLLAILMFFIIDFFSGVGKYIGLFQAIQNLYDSEKNIDKKRELKSVASPEKLKKSLQVDGIGNIIGSLLGASSVAVFVSSAVGIRTGGIKGGVNGLTAVFTSIFILISLVFIPFVGAIPVVATTGILIYIGFLLVHEDRKRKVSENQKAKLDSLDILIIAIACIITALTYSMDFAMTILFTYYAIRLIYEKGLVKENIIFIVTALLLISAVTFKLLIV